MEITSNPLPMSSPESGISVRGSGFKECPESKEINPSISFDLLEDVGLSHSPTHILMVGKER